MNLRWALLCEAAHHRPDTRGWDFMGVFEDWAPTAFPANRSVELVLGMTVAVVDAGADVLIEAMMGTTGWQRAGVFRVPKVLPGGAAHLDLLYAVRIRIGATRPGPLPMRFRLNGTEADFFIPIEVGSPG